MWAPPPRLAPGLVGLSTTQLNKHELLATAAGDKKVKLWRSPV